MRLITDAPIMVVREAMAFVPGATFGSCSDEHPLWAETVIESIPSDALAMALGSLGSYVVAPWRPKFNAAYGDPVMAIAAANIERGGSSSAPAAATAR